MVVCVNIYVVSNMYYTIYVISKKI
jgi:hypothetical protein